MGLLAECLILLAVVGPDQVIRTVAGTGKAGDGGDGGPAAAGAAEYAIRCRS